jgi:hypothetical protein
MLTPPFPIAGFGVVLLESLLSALLVSVYWVTYPRGLAQVGALLAAMLLACWFMAWSIGARVLVNPKHRNRAKIALGLAGALGCWSLVLGLLVGPHLAALCVWGVLGQLVALAVARMACAT